MFKIKDMRAFLARFSKREKAVFYAAGLVLLLTILDRLVISPITDKIKSLEDDIAEEKSSIKKSMRILRYKDRIVTEKKRYKDYMQSSKSEEEEMTGILKVVEKQAKSAGIYLIDMKPGDVKKMASTKKYTVNLNCEAQMEQLIDFMYEIESSKKLLTIERFQIAPKSRESSVASCRLTISKLTAP